MTKTSESSQERRASEKRLEAIRRELHREIAENMGKKDFFGSITAEVVFQNGEIQYSRVNTNRIVRDS